MERSCTCDICLMRHGRWTARALSSLTETHRDVHASVVVHPSLDSGAAVEAPA
eukprot:CAMPEP_0185395712 /NCGR_PEP_ID=MMETSP1364-20130426/83286_1 /TAXON_ID=38817 /ORGANISM="Gephyrocapsa oceanica, Strain RCC1303" /LENGTH=52 /DNA_ID=CAMNT_0027997893 /DNA_START=7 /DNA_END=162 /DNA_ORIENTATION=+